MMQLCDGPQPRPVFRCGLRGVSALDLDKDDLEGIAALQSFALCVILANRYQVYYAPRFAAVRPRKAQEVPARERSVGDGLPEANLSHGHSPLLCVGRDLEAFLVVAHIIALFLRWWGRRRCGGLWDRFWHGRPTAALIEPLHALSNRCIFNT